MDIVPRLLGTALEQFGELVDNVLRELSKWADKHEDLFKNLTKFTKDLLGRKNYRPLGMYQMLIGGQLQIVDSSRDPELLVYSMFVLLEHGKNVLQHWGRGLVSECVTSHFMKPYISSLNRVFERIGTLGRKGNLHLDWTTESARKRIFSGADYSRMLHMFVRLLSCCNQAC